MRPVINSIKHYIQQSLSPVTSGTNLEFEIALAKQVQDITAVARHVRAGSVLKAIYIELWAKGATATASTMAMALTKLPSGNSGPSTVDMGNINDYANKKNILFFQQGTTNDSASVGVPLLRQWIKIPKSKQRWGLEDSLTLTIHSFAETVNVCGFATYKEYF